MRESGYVKRGEKIVQLTIEITIRERRGICMVNVKFEECYLKNKEDFISVEDLFQIHNKDDGSYEKFYLGNFYCSECFCAQLSFHPNAQTPHFRSNGIHNKHCSYNFMPASKKQIEEYCNDQTNRDAINRKLKSCLELLREQGQQINEMPKSKRNKNQSKNGEYYTVDTGATKRTIRRKKLTSQFVEDDYNIPMIFYGTVLLEWDLRKDAIKFLRIRNTNKCAHICSISISKNIYSYMDESMKFQGKRFGKIAFLSYMEKKDQFKNCKIKYSTELVIYLEI